MQLTSPLVVATLLAASLSAQNLVPNGHFDQGQTNWTFVSANDPIGTYGFNGSRVTGNGPSMALFGNFQTLTAVYTVTYRSAPFNLVATVPYPVSIAVMFEKIVPTAIGSPANTRVEFRIVTPTSTVTNMQSIPSPGTTALQERVTWSGTYAAPATGAYMIEIFMRHSNLATVADTHWVDDVVVGTPDTKVYGKGCAGTGGYTPVIGSTNAPLRGSSNFSVDLTDALGTTPALCTLGASDTSWGPIPLPYQLGGGCSILASIDVSFGTATAGSGAGVGTASQLLPVPNNPALAGVRLFTQWFAVDTAAANPFTLASTAGLYFTIQ